MEGFLILCLLVIVLAAWVSLRKRLAEVDSRIADLSAQLHRHQGELALLKKASIQPAETAKPEPEPVRPVAATAAPPSQTKEVAGPPPAVGLPTVPTFTRASLSSSTIAPPRSTEEWEALLGGNWLNKAGVFILVVGIALALGYSFTRLGPWGRVGISLAASLALLAAGAVLETREPYRMFARGLLGGGWAALYVTVFAMHAVDAARVIPNPIAGGILLLGVAVGMIAHSLLYRSQTVTGVAYFVAFASVAITQTGPLPLVALLPLAISLLYVAHRFSWERLAMLGLLATYSVCLLRDRLIGPLFEAEALLAAYWLLFEIFDVLHPEVWLLPLNAAGFLGLSITRWRSAAPGNVWLLLVVTAAAYLVGAAVRIRTGKWMASLTVSAALAAAAAFEKLDHQWIAAALVVEAELLYLAGIRLRAPYMRWLGNSLFALAAVRLLLHDVAALPVNAWAPMAASDAVIFYLNRALYPPDVFFGYAGSALFAIVAGNLVAAPYRATALLLMAAAAFAFGCQRRLPDFRFQGYLLGTAGLIAIAFRPRELSLSGAVAVAYAVSMYALWSSPDRFGDEERRILRWCSSCAGTLSAATLVWRQVSGSMLTVAWGILGLALLASGFPLRDRILRISGLVLLLGCILKLFAWDLRHLETVPRIFSFIALGLILVGVSWVYTRFRERVSKYL
jgi:uncharacterized membrane protein